MSGRNNTNRNSNRNNGSNNNRNNVPNLGLPQRSSSFLPMRSMSSYPVESASRRPADIPAYLEAQGVPLNIPIVPGDTGVGPLPRMSIYVQGATPEQMQEVYRRERASQLYQMLSDSGYFAMNPATRPPARELLARRFQPRANSIFTSNPISTFSPEPSPPPVTIPVIDSPELVMNQRNLGQNAVTQDDFVDGETVEVLYSEEQARNKREGRHVQVMPSMVYKSESVQGLLSSGNPRNPLTREPIALRERRTLRFRNNSTGGKRKHRKSRNYRKSRKVYYRKH